MPASIQRRPTPRDLLRIHDTVAYDPSAPNGLRWLVTRKGPKPSGNARTVWIAGVSYQASYIVMILNNKWPTSDDCVVTRIDANGTWGDVANLEWSPLGSIISSGRKRNQEQAIGAVFGNAIPSFDSKHRLSKLCKRGHRWNGHPVSLFVKHGNEWRCKECLRQQKKSPAAVAAKRAWYEANKEEQRKKGREYQALRRANPLLAEADRQRNRAPEAAEKRRRYKQKVRLSLYSQGLTSKGTAPSRVDGGVAKGERALDRAISNAGRSPSVARLVMNEQRRYWRSNPEARLAHVRQWARDSWWLKYQTDPELRFYVKEKSHRRKAQERGLVAVALRPAAIIQRFSEFDYCCAYCGSDDRMEIEHVRPISKGGAHDISNIVPACQKCNASKRVNPMEDWYRSQPFFSELRLRKIQSVTGDPEGQQLAFDLADLQPVATAA